MKKMLLVMALLLSSPLAVAQASPSPQANADPDAGKIPQGNPQAHNSDAPRAFQFAPQIATVFPTFIGGGAALSLFGHYELNLMYGVTPELYHEAISKVAADVAGEPSYEGIVNTAFDNNSVVRSGFLYNFRSALSGWNAGFAFSLLKADGIAQLEDVAESSNSSGLAALLALLLGANKDPSIQLKSELFVAELNLGYKWQLAQSLSLGTNLGVAKVMSAEMELSTELPNYDNSAQGKKTLRETEADLEEVVVDYGITPTLAFTIAYYF